jgi:tetratricopeptide (TPR) repeat protein
MCKRGRWHDSERSAAREHASTSRWTLQISQSFRHAALASLSALLIAAPAFAATPAKRSAWQEEYWAHFDTHDWDGAIARAESLVAAARPATDQTALQLSEALSLLGNAQFSAGNLVAAEAAFKEALQLTEKHADRSSGRLIDPLRGMGFTLSAQGKHDKAVPYLDRALLISRRSIGLYDVSQQALLRQLAESLATIGEPVEGEKHMKYMVRMGEHAYGKEDRAMVPLLCLVARWYADVAQMDQARSFYRRALDVAEESAGRNDILVVEPLRGLARTFTEEIMLTSMGIDTRKERLAPQPEDLLNEVVDPYNPRFIPSEGDRALLRAIKTLEGDPNQPASQLIETLVQLGDWYLLKMQPTRAMPYYTRAASIIDDKQQSPKEVGRAATLLSFPAQVYYPSPPLAQRNKLLPAHMLVDRFVQVEFTVEPDGKIKDPRIVDKDGSERQARQTLEAIEEARYRPKFVSGKPVQTQAVSYRQIFRDRKESE